MVRWSIFGLWLAIPVFIMTNCASKYHLTAAEKAKLDPALQKLVQTGEGAANRYDVHTLPDGSRVYGVIIRTDIPQALRKAGIPVNSVFGDVATARLTITELRKVAKMPTVLAVENSSKNYPSDQ